MKNLKSICLGSCLAGLALVSVSANAQRFPYPQPHRPGAPSRDVEVRLGTTLYPGERLPLLQILDLDRSACNSRLERVEVQVNNRNWNMGELRLVSNNRFPEGSRFVTSGYTRIEFLMNSRSNILCRDLYDLDLENSGRAVLQIETVRAVLDNFFRPGPDRPRREREEVVEIRFGSVGGRYAHRPIDGEVVDMRVVKKHSGAECRERISYGFDRNGIWVDRGCEATFRLVVVKPIRWEPRPYIDRVECESRSDKYKECPVAGQPLRIVNVIRQSSAECREGRSYGLTTRGIWVDRGCRAFFDVEVRR